MPTAYRCPHMSSLLSLRSPCIALQGSSAAPATAVPTRCCLGERHATTPPACGRPRRRGGGYRRMAKSRGILLTCPAAVKHIPTVACRAPHVPRTCGGDGVDAPVAECAGGHDVPWGGQQGACSRAGTPS